VLKNIIMPRLGDTSTEGWVEHWERGIGDTVEMGDIICVVSVDKAAFELESPYDGTIQEILIKDGEVVPIGTTIARLEVD
jgi:pyruvate/2-oxoglutarate dehydrogenase complex dihydrolipoamide acyltransferase (E2) component